VRFFPIPHGVVCGTLVGAATRDQSSRANGSASLGHPAWRKYARAGDLLNGRHFPTAEESHAALLVVAG
jgi:hypothetical protein